MAGKVSMDILIEDMKKQDAHIEAEIQTYASLLGNVEKHMQGLKKRQEEKEIFERLLYKIGGERDFFEDSATVRALEDLAAAEERGIAGNNNLIKEQQAYYEALRKKDYQALWGQDEDKSALAAICFAFERWKGTSAKLASELLLSKKKNVFPEWVARYFLEKALAYSESRQETDAISEETDILLSGMLRRTCFPQFDAVWQNIKACLNIRKTRRTFGRCKAVLEKYQEQKSQFKAFEQAYADNYKEILEEIQSLEKQRIGRFPIFFFLKRQRIGREVDAAVKSTKKWFLDRTAELEGLINRRRNAAVYMEEGLRTLQSLYAELENGMGVGLQPERCDAICNILGPMERVTFEAVDAKKLDKERKQLLEDYQAHLNEIKEAKDAAVERAKAKQRKRVEDKARAKTKRKERAKKFVRGLKAAIVAVGILYGIEWLYAENVDYLGTSISGYLPNVLFGLSAGGAARVSTESPYFISLRPMRWIEVYESSENLSLLIIPFGAKEMTIKKAMENIKIHNGTEVLRLNCEKLKKLTIPDSVTSLELYNLKDELALTLDLPENLESLTIKESPGLTAKGFRALEIPESAQSLNILYDYDDSGIAKGKLISADIPEDAFTWNGHSYYLYNNAASWEEAESYCESLGGHLAIIESAEENEAIYSYITEQGYKDVFFGASDAAEEGNWRWADGSEMSHTDGSGGSANRNFNISSGFWSEMSYTNWHDGEPNAETDAEDYAMYSSMFTDGTWNDSVFNAGAIFICEWDRIK